MREGDRERNERTSTGVSDTSRYTTKTYNSVPDGIPQMQTMDGVSDVPTN